MRRTVFLTLFLIFFIFNSKVFAWCDGASDNECGECSYCSFNTCVPSGDPYCNRTNDHCADYPAGYWWACVGEGGDRACTCCPPNTEYKAGGTYTCTGAGFGCCGSDPRLGSVYAGTQCFEEGTHDEYCLLVFTNTCQSYSCQSSCDANLWGEWTPASYCGTVTQTRTNDCGSTESRTSTCTECGPTISAWSSCDATTHKRTRTCTTNCGNTALCDGVAVEQECLAEIRGTIFDASELDACPSFDPTTGYITTLDPTLLLNTRTFSMSDGVAGGTHPWSILTNPITTNSGGNYSVSVYAPSTYTYDFSALRDIYVVSDGPKLTCQSAAAVVPSNDVSCATQPCTTVKNMSFGFLRYVGGWWQTQGAGVHGESGVKSNIPDTLPTEQSLILKDANNRAGVLSYGQDLSQRFGLNNEATVSATGLEVESTYQGLAYDFAYYKQQFKKYSVTDYDPQTILTYDDLGKGYQIFRVTGNIDNFDISPSGTNKMIFLVDGDVTISSNIVVPTGAFLSVIAKGNLTVNTDVTRVDGWYVAKNISVPCIDLDNDDYCDKTDSQFVGNGSFVAWGQVTLSRDQGAALNEIQPSEKFVYRIDLYDNAPDPMKVVTRLYKPFIP